MRRNGTVYSASVGCKSSWESLLAHKHDSKIFSNAIQKSISSADKQWWLIKSRQAGLSKLTSIENDLCPNKCGNNSLSPELNDLFY